MAPSITISHYPISHWKHHNSLWSHHNSQWVHHNSHWRPPNALWMPHKANSQWIPHNSQWRPHNSQWGQMPNFSGDLPGFSVVTDLRRISKENTCPLKRGFRINVPPRLHTKVEKSPKPPSGYVKGVGTLSFFGGYVKFF